MSTSVERDACILVPDTTYKTSVTASPVRICVIDLGTNSFHAVIVDAHPNGSFKVVDRMKEMVRLGKSGLASKRLPDDAMERGMKALKRIDLLARGWDTREFLAFATSAIRESENGGEFIEQVRKEVGLRIRPISGEQEATLIYQGVKRAVDMPEPTLCVDIGGGSVEFIVVKGGEAVFATSLKLGAARMTERFVTTDPLSDAERQALRSHFHDTITDVVAACKEHGVTTMVGSSGTAKSLARVCVDAYGDESRTIFQQDLPVPDYRKALDWVIESEAEDRIAHPAIDPKRVDQIGAGALLMDTICDRLPAVDCIKTSSNALREGMVVHFIEDNYTRIRRMAPFRDVRRRSVHEIAFRFDWEERHAQHVAATAGFIFNACRPIYQGPDSDAELLEYAALLHDIGYHISHARHHKHSRYLIWHADLQGFQPEEIKMIALTARYHRKAFPKNKHKRFRKLTGEQQERVRQMAALLRIAEGLDRSHFQNVIAMQVRLTDEALTLSLETKGDPQLEMWAGEGEASLFQEVFGREVVVGTQSISVRSNGHEQSPTSVTHATPSEG
jgi:exopolyphosphatase/guanosine-5'-triphosphate,3'-diphosphate pyrophosphatase